MAVAVVVIVGMAVVAIIGMRMAVTVRMPVDGELHRRLIPRFPD